MTQTKSIAAMLCVLALALVGCGPSRETARLTLGQATLDTRALDANDPSVRRAAVHQLTDRALLAKLAQEAEGSDIRYAANQRLAELAIPDPVEPAGARAGNTAEPDRLKLRAEAWQRFLAGRRFGLSNADVSVLSVLAQFRAKCEIHMIYDPAKGGEITFTFVRDGKELLSIEGHQNTVFCTAKNVLYFAHFSTSSQGCTLTAHDLDSGKQLWETKLNAIPLASHAGWYSNKVSMFLSGLTPPEENGEGVLEITGRESDGSYIEILDRETGRILAHKIYRQPTPEMETLLRQAFTAFEDGRGEEARRAFASFEPLWEDLVKANPNYWDKETLYEVAVCYYCLNRYDISNALLRSVRLGSAIPRPGVIGYSILTSYRTADFENAIGGARRFDFRFPRTMSRELEPEYKFAVADSYLHLGDLPAARTAFQQMEETYKDSEWASKAKTGLRQCESAEQLMAGGPQSASEAIGYFAGTDAWDMLLLSLQNKNPEAKQEAAARLGNVTGEKNLAILLSTLRRLKVIAAYGNVPEFHKEFTAAVVRSLEKLTGVSMPDLDAQSADAMQAAIDAFQRKPKPNP